MYTQNAITIEGYSQFQIGAGAFSNPLDNGTYDVWAAADSYISVVQNTTTPSAPISTTGFLIKAGLAPVSIRIGRDGLIMGASAAISVHRVE